VSKRPRRPHAPPATKAEALARLARIERRLRRLERALAASEQRGDDAERQSTMFRQALAEALDRQTATSQVLDVISRAPTDLQPLFETIVRNAVQLCDGFFGIVFRYDGHQLSIAAHHKFSPRAVEMIARAYPAAPGPQSMAGLAVLRRDVIHVSDVTLPGPDTTQRSQQLGLELG
jgi:hypothetical protein